MKNVFTPRDYDTDERLKFNVKDVKVIEGNIDTRGISAPKVKGIVEIKGKRYKVYTASCGSPNCFCDARIKEIV